jgi:hypothetical protein
MRCENRLEGAALQHAAPMLEDEFSEGRAHGKFVQPWLQNVAGEREQLSAGGRGFTVPVLVDADGGIIAGHGRVLAAKQLGLVDIPVMVAAGWSEAQKRAYVIADNKLTMNGGWDNDLLRGEFAALEGLKFDLDMLGFEPAELAAIRDVRPTLDGSG